MTSGDPRRAGRAAPLDPAEMHALLAVVAPFQPLALGVSGGADSMALLHIVATARLSATTLTVDHALQPHSGAVAAAVCAASLALGLPACTLRWSGAKPATGVQNAARIARLGLLTAAAREHGCNALLLAHTLDDQAETLLMRLARGSGVTGLGAMAPAGRRNGVPILRPLLGVPRARLLATLVKAGIAWHDDPGNTDPAFERVALRRQAAALAAAGLSPAPLALAAQRLRRADAALAEQTACWLLGARRPDGLDFAAWQQAPEEIALRALARLISEAGGRRPGTARLERLGAALRATTASSGTLAGCVVHVADGVLRVRAESMRRRGRL